jgi:hypothetical protein
MDIDQFKQKIAELTDQEDIEQLCLKLLLETARDHGMVFVADVLYLVRQEFERF